MLILGDIHLSRKLPHSRGDDRYQFRLNLLKGLVEGEEEIVLLGDVCDVPNVVDGRILSDMIDVFSGKKIYHVLGNHDRHSTSTESSAGECLSKVLPGYECFTKTEHRRAGDAQIVFAPYYSSESEIAETVLSAEEAGRPVTVFGHWNFYSPIFGGKKFAKSFLKKSKAFFCLGHIHTKVEFDGGMHIGVISPLQFGEKAGSIARLNSDGTIKMTAIEGAEEFHTIKFGEAPFKNTNVSYARVIYDGDRFQRKEVLERYKHLKGVYLMEEEVFTVHEKRGIDSLSEEEIIISVAKERNFKNTEVLVQKHQKIKGGIAS